MRVGVNNFTLDFQFIESNSPQPMHRIDHIGGNPTKSENKVLTLGWGKGKKKSGSTIINLKYCPQS